jgi:hypothetical protein
LRSAFLYALRGEKKLGQINPFLAVKVSAEELESALKDLHRRLVGEAPVAKRKPKATRRAKQAERV